jgi:hypothetical protein
MVTLLDARHMLVFGKTACSRRCWTASAFAMPGKGR